MEQDDERSNLSRRDFLKALGLGAGAVFLGGCAPQLPEPTSIPSITPSPTLTPFQPSLPTLTPRPTQIPSTTPTPWTFDISTPTAPETATSLATQAQSRSRGKLCFVLWDHQLARYNYKPRNPKVPLPQTCPLLIGKANRMTEAWEAYWRGILMKLNPSLGQKEFEGAWKSLVHDARAFTNNKGLDSGNFALWDITCGGATHEVVSGEPEGPGGRYTRIYTLSHKAGPPSLDDGIDMTRHFMATTGSTKQLADGSYAVYGFPQFENCIVPLISPDGTDLIETERIVYVSSIQRPYNT